MINYISQTATFHELYLKLNEIIQVVNFHNLQLGDISGLTTLNKDSLVNAINEKSPSLYMSMIMED